MTDLNKITETIIGSAITVHQELGAGLLESAYEACLVYELTERGLSVQQQKALPVNYRGVKVVERLEPIHEAQLLSCLKLSGYRVGLLINFNVKILKQGIKRLVNNLEESL